MPRMIAIGRFLPVATSSNRPEAALELADGPKKYSGYGIVQRLPKRKGLFNERRRPQTRQAWLLVITFEHH